MGKQDANHLVVELSGELLKTLAPHEVPMFKFISEAYIKDPQSVLKQNKKQDDMLGFGTAEVVTLLSPVVLAVLKEVVAFLTAEVSKNLKEEASSVIQAKIKNLFHLNEQKEMRPDKEINLSIQQLDRIRQITTGTALKLNMSSEKASLLADSIVGQIAVKGV